MENIRVDSTYILMPSDRSGSMQLYLYKTDGMLVSQLTDIHGEVTDVYGYDEKSGTVY
jgi:dipeptidyl-peptidase-4